MVIRWRRVNNNSPREAREMVTKRLAVRSSGRRKLLRLATIAKVTMAAETVIPTGMGKLMMFLTN